MKGNNRSMAQPNTDIELLVNNMGMVDYLLTNIIFLLPDLVIFITCHHYRLG